MDLLQQFSFKLHFWQNHCITTFTFCFINCYYNTFTYFNTLHNKKLSYSGSLIKRGTYGSGVLKRYRQWINK